MARYMAIAEKKPSIPSRVLLHVFTTSSLDTIFQVGFDRIIPMYERIEVRSKVELGSIIKNIDEIRRPGES